MEDLKKAGLAAIAVIILASVTLLGIAIVDNYGYVVRASTTATNVALTTVVLDTPEAVGATGTYPFLQTATPCYNATNASQLLTSTMYSVAEGDEDGGTFTLLTPGAAYNNTNVNCTITYLADTTGSDGAELFVVGLGVFGTFTSIIVLAIVGLLVINIFRKKEY